jgi:signal transduction histidine kinase
MSVTDKKQDSRIRSSCWPWIFAFLVALAGTGISILLWHTRTVMERNAVKEEFHFEAQNLQGMVAQEIQLFMDVLDSIRQLHSISDQINARDFAEFVDKGMSYQKRILQGFGFVQRTDHETRQLMQRVDTNSLQPSLIIRESDGQNGFKIARDKPEYYALTYQTPEGVMGVPTGFDFSSANPCLDAIHRMLQFGGLSLGGKRSGSAYDYYVFAPILYSEFQGHPIAPPGYLVGFAVAVFRPEQIVLRVAKIPAARNLKINLTNPDDQPQKFSVFQKSVDEGDRRSPGAESLAESERKSADSSRRSSMAEANPPASDPSRPDPGFLAFSSPISVADHTWSFQCTASPDYLLAHRTHRPELILLIGFTITVLVTFELFLLARRGRKIEQIVQARTTDLLAAKAMIEREMSERMRLESEILEISSREKLRIGQDLHDSLGQKLTGAVFLSRTLATKLADAGGAERDSVEHINELLKDSLAQVRRLARGLAPVELGDEGLANALHRLAADTQETYGIDCVFRAEDDGRVRDNNASVHLFHIAQEAVSNAVRHGKPGRILITLAAGAGDGGRLVVEDDGGGISREAARGQGMGLRIMNYRAAMIGGSLDIQRGRDRGAIVTCRFQGGS